MIKWKLSHLLYIPPILIFVCWGLKIITNNHKFEDAAFLFFVMSAVTMIPYVAKNESVPTVEFEESILKYTDKELGVIADYSSDNLLITKESWAPGIWVGTEGMEVKIDNQTFTVKHVDPYKRVITFNKKITSDISPGSVIYRRTHEA